MENLNTKNCDISDKKSYDVLSYLKKWQKIEGNTKKYKCKAHNCEKTFTTNEILKSHMSIHANHKCYICDKGFGLPWDLKSHIHSDHDKLKHHKCDHCDKTFSVSWDLNE